MAAPVTAPYAPSYATYTPYLTPAEFLAEPTGVDTSQLVPRGSGAAVQTAALTRIIGRASSWADQYCRKVLAATLDVQSGEYRIRTDGTIRVPVDNTPLIQVTDVKVGTAAGQLTTLTDLSGCRIGKKVVRIPVLAAAPSSTLSVPRGARSAGGWLFADVTYINGYAHALTAASSAAGAMVLQVTGTGLGIVPGLPLTVYDGTANGADTEQVVVDSSYVFGSPFVPLTAPMLYAHGAGCSVSALPGFVREAVINMTSALIKTRGSDSYVMPSGPSRQIKMEASMPGGDENISIAMELLEPLRRTW